MLTVDAKVSADGSGRGIERIGCTQHHATSLHDALAGPYHRNNRPALHVLDERWEESLALEILVVLLEQFTVGLHHLHGEKLETALLKALNDFSNESALDTVRLYHNISAFHLGCCCGLGRVKYKIKENADRKGQESADSAYARSEPHLLLLHASQYEWFPGKKRTRSCLHFLLERDSHD